MAEKNSYLVTKALNSYLKGSVIIAISGHLVTTTDAIIVSWLIGPKAFTAVNTVIPILTFFSAMMIMLSTGVAVSVSKAIGNRNKDKVNLSSSSAVVGAIMFGTLAAVVTYEFSSEIVNLLVHGDLTIYQYAIKYLKTYCFAIPFLIITGVTSSVVRTDGNSRLVSIAVWIGIIFNVVLDIIFVRFLKLGISGAAWGTSIDYILVLGICLFHFASRNNTIKWSSDFKKYPLQIWENCKLGFSTSLTNILLAVSLFVINSLMLHYQGSEGLYCWAVCYQIFLIAQMLLSGIDASIFAIGGVLLGEDDVKGLNFLYRRSALYLIIGVSLLSVSIVIFPEFYGKIFGNRGEDKLDLLPSVLKIFSLFLLPYSLVMQVRSIYTILERGFLSLFLCVLSYALMILLVFVGAHLQLVEIWWSFPTSSLVLLIGLLIYTAVLHIKNKNLRMFSLIPKTVKDPILNISVSLKSDDNMVIKNEMSDFLKSHNIMRQEIIVIISVIGDLTDKIRKHLENEKENKRNRFFDINLRIKGNKIIAILKDDGERLSREEELMLDAKAIEDDKSDINTNIPTNSSSFTTTYFYMNDQNNFTLNFNLATN